MYKGVPVTVTIKDAGGSFAVAVGSVTVNPALPMILGIGPDAGPTSGGTAVGITGTDLGGAIGVFFGGVSALFSYNLDGSILAISPAESAGTVDVRREPVLAMAA
jgi:hypothetical protein